MNHKSSRLGTLMAPVLFWQVPGSGKTTVITRRIQSLIELHHINPEEILVITFTKAASLEMDERFQKLCGNTYLPVTFGTFHAVFFHILQNAYHFTASNIITEKEKQTYLKIVLNQLEQNELEDLTNEDVNSLLLSEIGNVKNQGIAIRDYKTSLFGEDTFRKVYVEYQKILHQNRKIDFDDMLLLCYSLLQQNESVRTQWQRQYKYILIDEFQDINALQYAVIKQLALPENNLFVVGDDDQSIYGFRGSKPEIMQQFVQEFKAEKILLDTNYRSTVPILQASLKVINDNKNRFYKKMVSEKKSGDHVVLYGFINKEAESENIIHLIEQYQNRNSIEDIAIIYRTNAGAGYLTEKLVERKIPFLLKESFTSIYQHFIAKDICSYLEFSENGKREAFYRIMNKPKRYLSREAVAETQVDFERITSYYREKPYMRERIQKLQYDSSVIKTMNPYAAINYIRKGIGYEQYLEKLAGEKNIPMQEWRTLLDEIQERARPFSDLKEWLRHIEDYEQELKRQKTASQATREAVSILTMHGSKGLEYPVVIIPDCNEGTIPHKKALLQEHLEEERRMFYVAMTRAKEKLFLFFVAGTKEEPRQPSRYLKNL